MAKTYTFGAFDREGTLLAQSRGRESAYSKALAALYSYRGAVEQGSGRLYGNPATLGCYSVDGVTNALGPTACLMDASDEIARLDRLGLNRVAEINAKVEAEYRAEVGA